MSLRVAFYKGTHAGWPGVYNRAVRAWECGPYSHAELIFSDGLSASASFMDGGVRFKRIDYDLANWDIFALPDAWEAGARAYFRLHDREGYDLLGNVHFVVGFVPASPDKKFCSKAIAEALGLEDGWRYEPNVLASTLRRLVLAHDQAQQVA